MTYSTREVFTPTTPAKVAFVDRIEINDKLVNALSTPGKQVVVYGHSGTGKTTLLLNKLHQVYECHITTRCMKGLKFDQLILDGFDQLTPFYTSEVTTTNNYQIGTTLSAKYMALHASINAARSNETSQKEARILPPQLTPQALGKFLGAARACWILEDFHKIDASEKCQLSQLMKVFMDLSDEYPDVKIVAIGAVDTARQVIEYDNEMRNRVAEIPVTLMTSDEIKEIIKKGEEALNVKFSASITNIVTKHSNGLASVCHHLCLNMCDAAGILNTVQGQTYQMTNENCESAVKVYVDEASDSIKSAFGKALKSRRKGENNSEIVIQTLSGFKEDGAARFDILRKIQKDRPSYPEHRLKGCLTKLCGAPYGEILRYDANSGLYSFSDPIYRAYALALYQKIQPSSTIISLTSGDFEEVLLSLIRAKLKVEAFKTALNKPSS